MGGAIAFPQADVTWRGVLCLSKRVSAVWGMSQHSDPGSSSLSSLPKATNCRLSSSVSSPLCPPSAGAQGKWLQKFFLCWSFKRLSEAPAISFWQAETLLIFAAECYLGSLWLWCCRVGSLAWGLDPTLSGETLRCWNILLALLLLPVGAQSALLCLLHAPYQSCLVKRFLLSVRGYKASLQLVLSWLFWMISLQFTCIFRLVLGGD